MRGFHPGPYPNLREPGELGLVGSRRWKQRKLLSEHIIECEPVGYLIGLGGRIGIHQIVLLVVRPVLAQWRQGVAILDAGNICDVVTAFQLGYPYDPDAVVVDIDTMRPRRDGHSILAGAGNHVIARWGLVDTAEVCDVVGVGVDKGEDEEVVLNLRHMEDLWLFAQIEPCDR